MDARRLGTPRLCVQSVEPVFGENYRPGFLGFTHVGSSSASHGIAHITGWSRLSDVHVDRVLVVTGEKEGVELVGGRQVDTVPLTKYFDDPKTQIFFRKPRKCSGGLATRIATTALAQIGTRFDQLLMAARLVEGSFLRRWLLSHFPEKSRHFTAKLDPVDARWLSAEFAAYCLDCQPEFAGRGVLGRAARGVSPQELFEDAELFAAWRQEPEEGPKKSPVV